MIRGKHNPFCLGFLSARQCQSNQSKAKINWTQSNDCDSIVEHNQNSIEYYPGFVIRLSNVIESIEYYGKFQFDWFDYVRLGKPIWLHSIAFDYVQLCSIALVWFDSVQLCLTIFDCLRLRLILLGLFETLPLVRPTFKKELDFRTTFDRLSSTIARFLSIGR